MAIEIKPQDPNLGHITLQSLDRRRRAEQQNVMLQHALTMALAIHDSLKAEKIERENEQLQTLYHRIDNANKQLQNRLR